MTINRLKRKPSVIKVHIVFQHSDTFQRVSSSQQFYHEVKVFKVCQNFGISRSILLPRSILNLDDLRVIRGKVLTQENPWIRKLGRTRAKFEDLPRTGTPLWNLIARHRDFDPKCLVTNPKLPTFNLEPVSVKTARPQIPVPEV